MGFLDEIDDLNAQTRSRAKKMVGVERERICNITSLQCEKFHTHSIDVKELHASCGVT